MMMRTSIKRFNPRVLAGGRDYHLIIKILFIYVSIHASSREDATSEKSGAGIPYECFNPRVLAGGRDLFCFQLPIAEYMFQSTRPRGRTRLIILDIRQDSLKFQSTRPRGRTRPNQVISTMPQNSFNPRVLAGGRDYGIYGGSAEYAVSIHASSREDATRRGASCRGVSPRFQSTRPRGRTRPQESKVTEPILVSIHASSREDATRLRNPSFKNFLVSIHASPREDAT